METQPIQTRVLSSFEASARVAWNCEYCDVDADMLDGTHVHGYYEIYMNLSGDVSFLHGDQIYRVESGDLFFSRPGDVHCCIYHSSCVHEHICIWFEEEGHALADYIARLGIPPYIHPAEAEKVELMRLLRQLTDAETDPILQTAYFTEFLARLRRADAHTASTEPQTNPRMREMLSYIEENYLQKLTPNVIASHFFISESTLNRLFRQHVGVSVAHLIEAKRLSHAEGLLRADATVTEACYASGFSDCSRFIARFKKKFGMTPLQYKKARGR